MKAETTRIALASLTENPGSFNWGDAINQKLGVLSENSKNIISLARTLSLGGSQSSSKNSKQIENIFSSLSLSDKPSPPVEGDSMPLGKLALTKDVLFPTKATASDKALSEHQTAFQGIVRDGFAENFNYLESVLSSLHRVAWCVPSPSLPTVSYYDQQRMTAALAVCLQDVKEDKIKEILGAIDKGKQDTAALAEPIALLVGGDISGIQEFIYTITAKGAAKSLRGRSFYLQLLTEAILRFVLRQLDLPYSSVIYSGGGHFFLLAPVSKASELDAIQKKITTGLWKHHRASMYFALGHTQIPASGFLKGNFPEYWGKMHKSMGVRKQKRFSELNDELYKTIFVPSAQGGNPDETCSACGEDHRKTRKWEELDGQESSERICTLCDSFIETIGRKLPHNSFIALGFGPPQQVAQRTVSDALSEFGMKFEFIESSQSKAGLQSEQLVVWALDDVQNEQWPVVDGATPKWIRYTANHVTEDSFDDLQKSVRGGFERLGVLRMDIDDLGELFKRGLGKDATITQMATLSFRISLFFEGWLKALCEKEDYGGSIYTVYSGGDDVFLIGPWDLIPDLALEIERDFTEYTGKNPYVHLSAGMAFIDGKYPVYQAAEDAKEAIDQAKRMDGKNAFTFLDASWKWSSFNAIAQQQEKLSNLVSPQDNEKKAVPQALLHVLQDLALQESLHKPENGRHVWGRWIWMGMYQLTRLQERNKDNAKEVAEILNGLQGNQYKDINQWGAAARWTELSARKKSKEDVK